MLTLFSPTIEGIDLNTLYFVVDGDVVVVGKRKKHKRRETKREKSRRRCEMRETV